MLEWERSEVEEFTENLEGHGQDFRLVSSERDPWFSEPHSGQQKEQRDARRGMQGGYNRHPGDR